MSFISIDDVSYSYNKKESGFEGLDLAIEKQGMTAIMGPNGCGKTTLTKLIMGVLKPDSGRITLDGLDISGMNLGQVGSIIGYLFQNPELQIFANTVSDELSFVLRLKSFPEEIIRERSPGIVTTISACSFFIRAVMIQLSHHMLSLTKLYS